MAEKCQSTSVNDSEDESQDDVCVGIKYVLPHLSFVLLQGTNGVTLLDSKLLPLITAFEAGTGIELY